MSTLWNNAYTRSELQRHVMDLRHLADIRPFELSDGPERGVRCLQARNAAGLDFTILADRGMGLYDAQFQGVPLAFISSVGERINTLARLFNVREGFARQQDTLPARNLSQPLQGSGPAKGHVVELDPMLDEYYTLMGWDRNGVPTQERLRELQLDQYRSR